MHRRKFIALGAVAAVATLAAGSALADAAQAKAVVDAAKAAGLAGEQTDGILGLVKPPSDPGLKAAVDEINAGRAQVYREAAARNGVTPEAAGASAFENVIRARIKPGEYYRTPGGPWTRK
ncbi:YdbL family protein [Phenylobacterium sp.]|uniref:YdbL family protein n=1 Tax=Phenylobacterium sp. TaxID=1871053 RepID=UPI002F41C2AF